MKKFLRNQIALFLFCTLMSAVFVTAQAQTEQVTVQNVRERVNVPFPGLDFDKSDGNTAILIRNYTGSDQQNLYHPNKLVSDLLASGCLSASNISFSGNRQQIGQFEKNPVNPSFPLGSGIIISTGKVTDGVGPNQSPSTTTSFLTASGDSDLSSLSGHVNKNILDVAVLEFDFVPDGDYVEFRYIFASEEYPEYACSQYNDVFGFFISGPGISGPYSNNSVNIALLPDGSPVTINNIHVDGLNKPGGSSCPDLNAEYYVTIPPGSKTIEYDGRTTVLTAKMENLVPCRTYHMKIAVADVSDRKYDSAVFLEAQSFSSGGSMINIKNYYDGNETYDVFQACEPNELRFYRTEENAEEEIFDYEIVGTAVAGEHYTGLSSGTATIPAGSNFVSIPYELFLNPIQGTKTIVVRVDTSCPCDDEVASVEKTIRIHDPFIIEDLTVENEGNCLDKSPNSISMLAASGASNYDYVFTYELLNENDETISSLLPGGNNPAVFSNLSEGVYRIRVSDNASCHVILTDPIAIASGQAPDLVALSNSPVCENETIELFAISETPGLSFDWTGPNGFSSDVAEPVIQDAVLDNAGIFKVVATAPNGCTAEATVEVEVLTRPCAEIIVTDVNCHGGNDGSIRVIIDPSCGTVENICIEYGALTEVCEPGNKHMGNAYYPDLIAGTYFVVVNGANGCSLVLETEVGEPEPLVVEAEYEAFVCEGDLTSVTITASGGTVPYEGTGAFDLGHGIHYLTVVDAHACEVTIMVDIQSVSLPEVSLPEFLSVCEDAEPFALSGGLPEGGTYYINGEEANEFDPANGAGTYEITYSYTAETSCSNTAVSEITVFELPMVSLTPFDDVCEHGPAFELTGGMPKGGVYSGPGVVDGIFDPTLVGAGTYLITYTYTSEHGCSNFATESIYVKTMYAFYDIVDAGCYGASDGAIYLEVFNGDDTYYFLWSNGATTQNLEGIPAGEYSVEISDGINCMLYVTGMVVGQSDEIIIDGAVTHVSEYGQADGSITTHVIGGNPPYEYAWSNGEVTPDISNIAAGTYELTVTDEQGCQAIAVYVVEEPDVLVDLQITIDVNNATPEPGQTDELIFTLVVTNLNTNYDATGVVVENILPGVFPFIGVTDGESQGSYDPANGIWTIGTIPAGKSVQLVYSTGMLLTEEVPSGVNEAQILPFDQEDPVLSNNYDKMVVTLDESTGGDDGGIESDGNMASWIALRNHKRLIQSSYIDSGNRTKEMEAFQISDMLTGAISTATLDGTPSTGIGYFIPEKGPAHTRAYLSTPADLLAITNAKEIIAVDYLQQNNSRRAGILAIASNPSTVYEHTKVICDRLTGASLEEISHIRIAGQPFILSKLTHPSGYVDYAVSFIATRDNNGFSIDNRWHNELYNPTGTEEVFNFQVWSVAPQFTRALVEEILGAMSRTGSLTFRNGDVEPEIPRVFVNSGSYRNGKLMLNLVNTNGATGITLRGSKAVVENGSREQFEIELTIPASASSSVEVPIGYLFDAGFSVSNNRDNTCDVLYYADGSWMFDYDPGNSVVTRFSTEAEDGLLHNRSYNIERNASISGTVRTYASLFRRLGPGTLPMDMTCFDQVVFNANGVGTVEVMIAKAGIHAWNEQYRTTITLNPDNQEYRINFSDLRTKEGQIGFIADDIISVIFNPIGNGSQASPFELNVSNLHFTNQLIEENESGLFYTNYPNPFRQTTTLDFVLKKESLVKAEVMNLYGQILEVLAEGYLQPGEYRLDWTPGALKSGIYMFRITIGNETYSGKMIYQPKL